MQILDLGREHRQIFDVCLEDWNEMAREAGTKRTRWVDKFLARGLAAKLAADDSGTVVGMIQYLPVEQSVVDGTGLYFIPCIWVHGYKQGRGDFTKKGMGSALLEAAEWDARNKGARGMAAWGLWLPFWMRASWFKKHGYVKADRQGLALLVWKPFDKDARAPRWFPRGRELPVPVPGKVNVTAFSNGWCMAQNLVCERARRASAEVGANVVFTEIDTSERSAFERWGQSDALFIDGKSVGNGPPPSYEKIKGIIQARVKRLR